MYNSITLFVAAYNKQEYIYDVLVKIYLATKNVEIDHEIIVINDGSSDNTLQEIKRFINDYRLENLILKNNEINFGLAKNFSDAVEMSTKTFIRLINGDDAEELDFHIKILKLVGEKDLIIPYYTNIFGRSKIRNIISSLFTLIMNVSSGNHIRYYNGAPVFKVNHLKKIFPLPLGMTYSAEIVVKLLQDKVSYLEVPTEAYSKGASSALSIQNFIYAFKSILRIVISRRKKQ